jgi:hypothetical protein
VKGQPRLFVLLACVLAGACARDQPAPPPAQVNPAQVNNDVPVDLRITVEQAIKLVQEVPGAKTHGLGVEGPDSIVQAVANAAAVGMLVDNERMTMHFVKQGAQWAWIGTTSAQWPGENKSPAEVMVWLASREH